MAQAMAKLPHSFTTLPAPGSAPKLYTRLPVARRTRLKLPLFHGRQMQEGCT